VERTAVDQAAPQQVSLIPREAEDLHWLAEGKTNSEIGTTVQTGHSTVGRLLERIFTKLGVETRTAVAARDQSTRCGSRRRHNVSPDGAGPELQSLLFSTRRVMPISSEDLRKLDGWPGPAYRPSLVRFIYFTHLQDPH
jgi:DNA-binding CsgD family transcriptional regulator